MQEQVPTGSSAGSQASVQESWVTLGSKVEDKIAEIRTQGESIKVTKDQYHALAYSLELPSNKNQSI